MKAKSRYLSILILALVVGGSHRLGLAAESVTKPTMPVGGKGEFIVEVPSVSDPLPAVDYMHRNDGDGRFYRDTNPINTILSGINDIWQGTTDDWQTTAGDYTRDVNGYKAGDGPGPDDYVTPGTEIKDVNTWQANVQYVIGVTVERTDAQACWAFLDDIRSKNYSVIDGFGPLTEDYAQNSGAYASFQTILATDVTENFSYKPGNNDSFSTYGGQTDSTLGDMVALASLFRNYHASTSGPKYLFGTPRPWRMNDLGEIVFLGVETFPNVVDGSSENRDTIELRIDSYETSVQLVSGLYCGRRAHSSSKEAMGLYSPTTENRRKDNGYPSGHTNAGVLASLAYAYMMPERFAEHVMRGSDLGENRVVAGMHSPVDVMGGRIQATMVAAAALTHNPDIAQAAYDQAYEYFNPKAEAVDMSLYEYAHQPVSEEGSFIKYDETLDANVLDVNVFDNNWYTDHEALKETYLLRMTYGLPQNGTPGLAPIVPEGAEVLLKTKLPYLTDEQRRAVLYTTSVDSGYPILDSTHGWGRLNLVAAADGYGAFLGDVTVNMDANEGRFNTHDWWRNDVNGPGLLTKEGTGMLTLTGDNAYEGGTLLKAGTLEAESTTALGTGDVYVVDGTLRVDAEGALVLSNLTLDDGSLAIEMDADASQIDVAGVLYIDGGDLVLDFSDYEVTQAVDIQLVSANAVAGEFESVTAAGVSVTLDYQEDAIMAHVEAL